MEARFDALVRAYQAVVQEMLADFRACSGLADPARWRDAGLPRVGTLPGRPPLEYEFHGVGLRLRRWREEVDFDFGHGGRSDGFDLWHLRAFAQAAPDAFPEFRDPHELERALLLEVAAGRVVRGTHGHDDGLYYLAGRPAATA